LTGIAFPYTHGVFAAANRVILDELRSEPQIFMPRHTIRHQTVGNLALAAEIIELADCFSLVAVPKTRPATPANVNASWADDRYWASGFLKCKTPEERLSHLRRWIEAAGGHITVEPDGTAAQLPKLAPSLSRVELLRFCRQLGVIVREARS
jgi:hypothetical protein